MKALSLCALLTLLVATPARAQGVDSRWAPWIGCWQMLDERVGSDTPRPSSPGAIDLGVRRAVSDVAVCVAPSAEPDGVVMTTTVAGRPALEQAVVADGSARAVTGSDCRGTQRATWSKDGRRLFASADLTCAAGARRVSGLTMFENSRTWLDIQSVDEAGMIEVRVRRYVRDGTVQIEDRPVARSAWTVEDVIESSSMLSPAVLESALIETQARFALTSRRLIALADAGVPGSLIDFMIAVSYPEKFVVQTPVPFDRGTFIYDGFDTEAPWGPWFYSERFSRAYFAPFGYYYSPYRIYRDEPRPTVPIVGGSGTDAASSSRDKGRVISGLGYTLVRPREASDTADADGRQSGQTAAARRAVVTPAGATQSTSEAPTSSGGASGSSGSSSEGSAESSGGRTAVPR